MEKKYQVFISSTYEDLKEERAELCNFLLEFDCIPVSMEYFPSSNMPQMEYIKKMMDSCDYYILILAGRYGSIDGATGISYTEMEYDYAVSKDIPVMSFLIDDRRKLPNDKREIDESKEMQLDNFIQKVSQNKLIKKYSSKEDLKAVVATSLNRCFKDYPVAGWVRGSNADVDKELQAKFDEYLQMNTASEDQIYALFSK